MIIHFIHTCEAHVNTCQLLIFKSLYIDRDKKLHLRNASPHACTRLSPLRVSFFSFSFKFTGTVVFSLASLLVYCFKQINLEINNLNQITKKDEKVILNYCVERFWQFYK